MLLVDQVFEGGAVLMTLRVPESEDVIVLLDPERRPDGVLAWHPFHNVVRIDPSGRVKWRAELVPHETTAKAWYGIEWDGRRLRAWTWSYDCELDEATGTILRTKFTK